MAKRTHATCGPVSCADANFAANAMTPKHVAENAVKMSARWVGETIKLRQPSKMDQNVTYRAAQPSDRDVIVDFQVAMARETEDVALDRAICTRGVAAVLADPSLGRYYTAESDGRVVASLLLTYEWSDWRNGMVWWIQSVYVVPEMRGQRVYGGLYEHVKRLAEGEKSVRGIRLYVDRRNTRAQQVYTRLGMDGEHYQVFEWMK
jgi:GNAT superfamily N-acetyltransferase